MNDYYEILNIKREASDKEIKEAYRKKALETHPDRAKRNNLTKEVAEEKFKKIQEAYETLIDPNKRAIYNTLNPDFSYSKPSEFKETKHASSYDFITDNKICKYIGMLFFSSSLKEVVKNISILDLHFSTRIEFPKGMEALTKSQEKEVLNILTSLGIPSEKISFNKPFIDEFLNIGPVIKIELEKWQLLKILEKNIYINRYVPPQEFKKSEHVDSKFKEEKSFDRDSGNFASWANMFPGEKSAEDEILKLVKLYNLCDTSQSELEKGLRRAAANKSALHLQKFIEARVDINAQDPKLKKTALHWAVEKNSLECVTVLLSNHADPSITDDSGKKPSDYLSIDPQIRSLLASRELGCLVM